MRMNQNEFWDDAQVVLEYARLEEDPRANWYEHTVNLPSLMSLMPASAEHVHDYGCGYGWLTKRLSENKDYVKVSGSDISRVAVEIAKQKYPGIDFFQWDGSQPLRTSVPIFDVVFSRLVLMFVDDLSKLAHSLYTMLKPGGCLVSSITHPINSFTKIDESYFTNTIYETIAGASGPKIQIRHRTLQDYLNPFLATGFQLDKLSEPSINTDQVTDDTPSQPPYPKRLNFRLIKSADAPAYPHELKSD